MNEIPDFFHQELSFSGVTPFPSLDLTTGKVEMGAWCRGCVSAEMERYGRGIAGRVTDHQFGNTVDGMRRRKDWIVGEVKKSMKAFSEEQFIQHALGCEGAKKIWGNRKV